MDRVPISSLLIKVHSRCNLMCDYCYEYNCGNTSWKSKPREMSERVFEQTLERIKDHCIEHKIPDFFLSFHGGEPLLRTQEWYRYAVNKAQTVLNPYTNVTFGMQTNATLIDESWVELFAELSIGVGVSLDGPKHVHDKYRVHSNGDPSFDLAWAGTQRLLTPVGRKIWGGILAVIDIASDPIEVFDFLAALDPPTIDFLEPHSNWERLPAGKQSHDKVIYGEWLIKLFDYWYNDPLKSKTPIRKFEEIIEHLLGGYGTLESFGLEPIDLATVATDGMYETVDCIKAAKPEAQHLGLNVFEDSLNDVLNHPMIEARQIGIDAVCDTCRQCDLIDTCGGGYYAHRYSCLDDSFRHPTIYCSDYYLLIKHIKASIENSIGLKIESQRV